MAYKSGLSLNPVNFVSSPIVLATANLYHKTLMNNAAWLAVGTVADA
jgi:hypothetical protein